MKNYIILQKCSFKDIPEIPFYTPMGGEGDNIDVLASCISYSRYDYKTFQDLKEALLKKKVLSFYLNDNTSFYTIEYQSEKGIVECLYGDIYKYISENDIDDAEIINSEDAVEQHVQFSLDVFIEVAEKIIDSFYQIEQWIIVWQDENEKIHVEPYQLTDGQRKKWKHYMKKDDYIETI